MKKKTTPKKGTAQNTVKRTAPRSTNREPVYFQRIVILSACLVLVVVGVVGVNRQSISQAVAGMSITAGLFNQATISIPPVPNAAAYNIYYRQVGTGTFTNAVRDVPPSVQQYTISDLKKSVTYEYRYAALDKHDKEFYFSDVKPLTNLQPM